MKKQLLFLIILFSIPRAYAQPVYNQTDYAANGDTVFLTQAQIVSMNFDTTGTNITWNYAALSGAAQRTLAFRPPAQTGFSFSQWPYIYNSSNVNLSSTDGQTVSIGNFQMTNPNDYFLTTSSQLEQKASSFSIGINSTTINIKNVYSSPDVLYRFPVSYAGSDSSAAAYTTVVPGTYYDSTSLRRVNNVNGWGTLVTPFGTFSNCLKVQSDLMQIDTMSIDTIGFPVDTTYIREFRWLCPGWNYPLLTVRQTKIATSYVTQSIEYYDNQQYFQPTALFAYLPVSPVVGDTVVFQNLSMNGSGFRWNFDDPASGSDDSSSAVNPTHIFNSADTFFVRLIAENGSLSDTIILPVIVSIITSGEIQTSEAPVAGLFPNPAIGNITLYGLKEEPGEIRVFDHCGKMVLQSSLTTTLCTGSLSPGTYTLVITYESASSVHQFIRL